MRLIDIEAPCKIEIELYGEKCHATVTANTVDAVPVVRCKDCRYHEDEQPGMVYCPATVGGWVEDDWFCKGGEGEADVI